MQVFKKNHRGKQNKNQYSPRLFLKMKTALSIKQTSHLMSSMLPRVSIQLLLCGEQVLDSD